MKYKMTHRTETLDPMLTGRSGDSSKREWRLCDAVARRCAWTLVVVAALTRPAQTASVAPDASARLLAQVEPRIKAIYETDEFRMLSFRGTWLPEGSGYFVYPNRDHGLHEGNGTEVHVRMLIIRYLLEHLPPGPR